MNVTLSRAEIEECLFYTTMKVGQANTKCKHTSSHVHNKIELVL